MHAMSHEREDKLFKEGSYFGPSMEMFLDCTRPGPLLYVMN